MSGTGNAPEEYIHDAMSANRNVGHSSEWTRLSNYSVGIPDKYKVVDIKRCGRLVVVDVSVQTVSVAVHHPQERKFFGDGVVGIIHRQYVNVNPGKRNSFQYLQ